MRFSLIVATVGRTIEFRRLLETLSIQTYEEFEVVVVDQNQDGRLTPIVESFDSLLRIKHLRSAKGLSLARNVGIENASGEIIAFPDDDCWYDSDVLERVDRWFRNNTEYAILSGSFSEVGVSNDSFPALPAELNEFNVYHRVCSVTIFFQRAVFDFGLRFCESLGAGAEIPASEEIDFVLRVLQRGLRGRYEPSYLIFHNIERESTLQPSQILKRDMANSFVLADHALRSSRGAGIYLVLKTLKYAFLSPFSSFHRKRLLAQIEGVRLARARSKSAVE